MKQILKNPKAIIFVIIVIVLVILVGTIIFINLIWKNNSVTIVNGNTTVDDNGNVTYTEKETNISEINKYSTNIQDSSNEKVSNNYFDEVTELLRAENYDKLYDKINKKYLDSQGFNKDSLYEYLTNKHLIGSNTDAIEMLSMEKCEQEDDVIIYRIKYKLKFYIGYINLIETFPYEYTIDFSQDTIPTVKEHIYVRTSNGIKFEITEKYRREDSITYSVKITNNNDEQVEFNFNTIANIGLIIGSSEEIKQTSAALSSKKTPLTKDSYIVKNMNFPINMQYQKDISGMIFHDVKIGNNTQNIVIRF